MNYFGSMKDPVSPHFSCFLLLKEQHHAMDLLLGALSHDILEMRAGMAMQPIEERLSRLVQRESIFNTARNTFHMVDRYMQQVELTNQILAQSSFHNPSSSVCETQRKGNEQSS